ncbi:MAG TPA: hypothetical protein VFG35_12615, partial [Actinoplanes sp.]|nr:hypothetical protein [Actinoplanes sp.]
PADLSSADLSSVEAADVEDSRSADTAGSDFATSVSETAPGAVSQVGFVALEDLLEQVIGRFDDETDVLPGPAIAARR